MDRKKVLEEAVSLLKLYRQLGLEQIELFKKRNPGPIQRTKINGRMMGKYNGVFMPIEDVTRRVSVREDTFLVLLLQGFWDYFLLNTDNIQSPSRQGIDRTLLEICYQKLVTYSALPTSEKNRKILITNLSDVGMILAQPSEQDRNKVPGYIADYDYWCGQLTRQEDRDKFKRLKESAYPTHAFADAKHKLWPSFYNSFQANNVALIFPWADTSVEGAEKAKSQFLSIYQHLHDFVHGSHLSAITALEAERTKTHLFASFAVSSQAAYQVLHTINTAYLGEEALKLDRVFQKTGEIIPKLIQQYSHLQP